MTGYIYYVTQFGDLFAQLENDSFIISGVYEVQTETTHTLILI